MKSLFVLVPHADKNPEQAAQFSETFLNVSNTDILEDARRRFKAAFSK